MELYKYLQRIPKSAIFSEEGYFVWCGSLIRHGDTYYLFYSRWKKEYGFDAWVTHSEIALASSKELFGEFRFEKVLFTKEDSNAWDRDCFHNPCVIQKEGKQVKHHKPHLIKVHIAIHEGGILALLTDIPVDSGVKEEAFCCADGNAMHLCGVSNIQVVVGHKFSANGFFHPL